MRESASAFIQIFAQCWRKSALIFVLVACAAHHDEAKETAAKLPEKHQKNGCVRFSRPVP